MTQHLERAKTRISCCLMALAIIPIASDAFTIGRGSFNIRTINKNKCSYPNIFHAMPSKQEDTASDTITEIDATTLKYEGDPRQALEQFGSLFSQVQAIAMEGGTWDNETLEVKTQEFVRTYLRIFVPGIGYALTSFSVFASAFFFCLLSLNLTGRGYSDILDAVGTIEPLRALLEKADPGWGNAAIALLGCEVLSPVILAATLALTPRTMDILQKKLDENGWGEKDIEERAADILRLTG